MSEKGILHSLDGSAPKTKMTGKPLIIMLAVAVVAGLAVGGVAGTLKKGQAKKAGGITNAKAEKTVGMADKKTFKDQAEGTLKEGGMDGEGSYHLQRPGGDSQNVYLTSSTVDLAQFIGKKVRVHGETFAAQKAGWLMDVGLVEILQ